MSIPISIGSGAASVAAEAVGGLQYQQIEVLGGGGSSTMGINPDGSINASIIGIPTVKIGGGSILSVSTGSVITVIQNSSIVAVPTGSVITVWQDSSVLAVPVGSVITVLKSSSIIAVATGSVISVPSGSVITVIQNSSIVAVPVGSVITVLQSSSILAVPVGSVVTVMQGSSILALSTITSIATANGGLHIWSPLGSRVQGTADLRTVQGTSVAVIAAQGSGVFTYIDHVQVLNFGSSSVLVTIADATTSILGYTIAPAGGGSNYDTFYKTAANNAVTASINGTASVLVSMQGFISRT